MTPVLLISVVIPKTAQAWHRVCYSTRFSGIIDTLRSRRTRLNLRPIRRFCSALLLLLALCAPAAAQDGFGAPPEKLPQDTGVNGLRQTLRRLQTTARLMETTAHPDDEDGGMLTLESRGHGATVLSLTLTRGEGGQNRTGSNLFDVLGILRTLEVLASDRYYGVEQRFTHVADFGFSKTAEETLQKWDGGTPALEDMVRVIRQFQPDVIVSRFQGNPRDGHGHHQAAGILTRAAFRAAADPNKFPEQIREGLQPWQAKKLYVGIFRRTTEDYSVALDTGAEDPLLGMSYAQLAVEGLKHQQSQGVGNWTIQPGPRLTYYKLVDSVLPTPAPGTHERDFFDGIDTSLPGLAARLGDEEKKVPSLRPALVEIQKKISEAAALGEGKDPSQAAVPLLQALRTLESAMAKLPNAALSPAAKGSLLNVLGEKQSQLRNAINLALGVELGATRRWHVPRPDTNPILVVPGETGVWLDIGVENRGPYPVRVESIVLEGGDWRPAEAKNLLKKLRPGEGAAGTVSIDVPQNALYTRPWEHRPDPERDNIYTVDDPRFVTLPFPPPPFHLVAHYVVEAAGVCDKGQSGCVAGLIRVPLTVAYQSSRTTILRPLAIGPLISDLVEPATQIAITARPGPIPADVRVHASERAGKPFESSQVWIDVPPGWRAEPTRQKATASSEQTYKFEAIPGRLQEGAYQVKGIFSNGSTRYAEGYTVVTRPDLGEFFYYQPAVQHISAVDLKVPPGLKVGYIMGAGDDIPTVLQQAGLDVHMISPEELAGGDLSQYGTIVVGIRAYDVRDDVRAHNQRLLDFVSAGGTLLVQYNASVTQFNDGHYAPYPLELSRERVTVEEAPVDVLAPQDGVFHFPNQITAHDFDGWVQERGLYFADKWDEHFTPLLACHDPGEPPQKGGLLVARYGKGTYLYTGYAFFRQLPAGVPGAIRLFVNLVSAGHEPR
jgi:LmbE family N-acetylglucosaminyl deacetylase